ncbi:hypothetical protein AVEN_55985-1 [Araneus ventricosus]|uniref:Uncharacterized protein n=1 Tax=Araneus ventricosus TaxID=182803 RepID=A0A4Y2PEU2_ARAVE|nr:hypothetical protein AVEN_55985-1 [Araneus ventricosus]
MALNSESLLGQAKSGVKSKTGKSKTLIEKTTLGSDDDFQVGSGLKKSAFSGKKGKSKGQIVPGTFVAPYRFGQANPFALQPVGVAPLETIKATTGSDLSGAYVGFWTFFRSPSGDQMG